MRLRFILAFLILLFACALQSWFASINIFFDFLLAALIVFAFFFDIWELIVFILFSIFVINWQPEFSPEIILFAIIPIAAYGFHKFFNLISWIAAPIALVVGFLIFSILVAPSTFFAHGELFLMDLVGGLVFGELVFLALTHSTHEQ